jgi:hypothetical protein
MKRQIDKTVNEKLNFQNPIFIDATVQEISAQAPERHRICWNTSEIKNCIACYLRRGCKAKE